MSESKFRCTECASIEILFFKREFADGTIHVLGQCQSCKRLKYVPKRYLDLCSDLILNNDEHKVKSKLRKRARKAAKRGLNENKNTRPQSSFDME